MVYIFHSLNTMFNEQPLHNDVCKELNVIIYNYMPDFIYRSDLE